MTNILYCWLSSQTDSSTPPAPKLQIAGVIVAPDGTAIASTDNFAVLIPLTYGITLDEIKEATLTALASTCSYTDPVEFVFLPQF